MPDSDWLVYGDAGLAFGQTTMSSTLPMGNGFGSYSGSRTGHGDGLCVGAGVQYAMGPNWSIGLDGLYFDLGNRDNVAVANYTVVNPATRRHLPSPQLSSRGDFSGFQLRLTAAYQYDGGASTASLFPSTDPNTEVPITLGMRAGYSTGQSQMTLYDGSGGAQASRLTYTDAGRSPPSPISDGRPDLGPVLTGFVGFGHQSGGNLQDEDFRRGSPLFVYQQPLQDGQLEYGVLDVGYNGCPGRNLQGRRASSATLSRTTITTPTAARRPPPTPPSARVARPPPGSAPTRSLQRSVYLERGAARHIRRLKIGGFTISGNAAWLPYIDVAETNYHWLRMPGDFYTSIPGSGSSSIGFQLEAKADYRITPSFDIGAGLRYW